MGRETDRGSETEQGTARQRKRDRERERERASESDTTIEVICAWVWLERPVLAGHLPFHKKGTLTQTHMHTPFTHLLAECEMQHSFPRLLLLARPG